LFVSQSLVHNLLIDIVKYTTQFVHLYFDTIRWSFRISFYETIIVKVDH